MMTQTSRQPAVVRHVDLAGAQAMREFVLGLSGASRHSRFHGVLNGVSPSLLRRLISADGEQQAACLPTPRGCPANQLRPGETGWCA